MSRYLTESEKRRELEMFRQLRAIPNPHGQLGGRGFLDHDIHPLCDALNQLEGVCTLQSCAGHPLEESDGTCYPGLLWIWPSREMSEAFDHRAFELALRSDLVDAVMKRYQPYGRELIEIVFTGNDKGKLDESAAFILQFFRRLAEQTTTG